MQNWQTFSGFGLLAGRINLIEDVASGSVILWHFIDWKTNQSVMKIVSRLNINESNHYFQS